MDHFLPELGPEQIVVDLGCGRGSFHYESYRCRVIGLDVAFVNPDLYRDGGRIGYARADSSEIPLASRSVDAVVSHHTMEHFADYRGTLREVDRVLKDDGLLWIAIPNGYSLDDTLYRFVFSGGGHVNRFSRDELVGAVHEWTRFRLMQEVDLYSGFIYLKKPAPEEYVHFPPSARPLYNMPESFNKAGILAINALTRVSDRLFGSRLSQYGWGFVFGGAHTKVPPIHKACFNVCSQCGSGTSAALLRERGTPMILGVGVFQCPHCGQKNAFVEPPAGAA